MATYQHELASTLLRKGERYARLGRLEQAVTLLAEVWNLSVGRYPELADTAAWGGAWLHVWLGAYNTAATWFSRVTAAGNARLWPPAGDGLARLCLLLAGKALGTPARAGISRSGAPNTTGRLKRGSSMLRATAAAITTLASS